MVMLKQNTPYTRVFYLAGTGLGPSATLSKNGASFATPAGGGGMTEIGSGFYSLTLQAADTDTIGCLAFSFSNGTNTAEQIDQVVADTSDPWAVALPGSYASGQAGYILGHSGGGTDPWGVPLPGSYASGQAGNILGNDVSAGIKYLVYLLSKGLPPSR